MGKTLQTIALILANRNDQLPQFAMASELVEAMVEGRPLPQDAMQAVPRGFKPYVSEGVIRQRK